MDALQRLRKRSCAVAGCGHETTSADCAVFMPASEAQAADWALNLGLSQTVFTNRVGVCAHHFADDDFAGPSRKKLKKDRIPYPPSSTQALLGSPSQIPR